MWRARRSVSGGVRGTSRILKSGWKAVKCSGTSAPRLLSIHAHSASMLLARVDGGTLRVEVEDWGRGVCTMRDPDTEAASGRGLRFVDALAHRWGTAPTPRGKTVWFELART